MFRMTPKNDRFYKHFDTGADHMVAAAKELKVLLEDPSRAKEHAKRIESLEHEADTNSHEAMELLHKSFITPIERSEIRRLVSNVDDVIDDIDDAALRIVLYEIVEIVPEAIELTDVLIDACLVAQKAISQIPNINKKTSILEHCIEMNRLEDKGDSIHHKAQAQLFKSGKDPLYVMKWREILHDIESSLDRVEDLAALLEGIVLENA